MTFTLQTDSVTFNSKPTPKDISAIKPRLAGSEPVGLTLSEFEKKILSGITYTPAVLEGGFKAENWKYQQIFCIDIDNEDKTTPKAKKGEKSEKKQSPTPLDVREVLKRCESFDIMPALIYETFSSTSQWLKFRIVFICSEVISDGAKRDFIQNGLQEIFPECDSTCKNRDRLFFGGKSTLYINENAVYSFDSIAQLGKAVSKPAQIKQTKAHINNDLDRLKAEFDFLGYIRAFGSRETKAGRLIRFNPCPICGHNDDFYYYPETNSFKCFGASGNVGGSVIDFIMHTRNLDRTSAIQYFKYDLCGISRNEDKAVFRKNCMVKNAEDKGIVTSGELPPYIYEKYDKNGDFISYAISCPILADFIRNNSNYIFVRDRATDFTRCYWYRNGCYCLISEQELKGYIKKHITDFDNTLLRMRDVTEVFNNLMCDLCFVNEELLNGNENIINFQNGLLYLDTLELKEHTPDIYSTIQIPCNWNPSKSIISGAPVFESFIDTFTGGDREKKKFLLQYMGVCLSNIKGYRIKKALFMTGAGNTGKSQLKMLTEKLLGNGNSAAIDLTELEQRFGTSKLYGKRLSGSSDMSYMSVNELKIFKQITGGDSIFAEFKGKPAFEFVYKGLLWFCTNRLPKFGGDRGNWVYDRIITLSCNNVIPHEKQDKLLLDKMYAEREAIVYMAIMGAKEVLANGHNFDIPSESLKQREEYKKENSPVATFFDECCVMRKSQKITDSCTTKKMHDVFKAWCMDNNKGYAVTSREFKKELEQILGTDELTKRLHGQNYYIFTLTIACKQDYVRVYGCDSIVS